MSHEINDEITSFDILGSIKTGKKYCKFHQPNLGARKWLPTREKATSKYLKAK